MSDQESTPGKGNAATDSSEPSLSLARVLKVVAPIVVILVGLALYIQSQLPSAATQEMEKRTLAALTNDRVNLPQLEGFADEDADLVADSPAEAECVAPEKLYFSYVASTSASEDAEFWKPVVDALTEKTGIACEFTSYERVVDQATALRDGQLHITAFNTGATPLAVASAGFVPTSTFGDSDGNFGVKMEMLVPSKSAIKELTDLRKPSVGKPKVLFVRPNSNSGFKAAFVLLMEELKAYPDRDYEYSFSNSYDQSMIDIAAGKYDVAAVVSDLLAQAVEAGTIEADSVRSVYESERFPPAAFGYAHNLKPEIREAIEAVLLELDWTGTSLAERYGATGATQFVPVNYKDDWANIRRINEALRTATLD